MKLKYLLLCALILMLNGCAQQLSRQTCMSLAKDVNYCLAPLLNTEQTLTQQVNLQVNTQRHQLMSQLELSPQQLTLVGLAPLGQALFTLTYDGSQLDSHQSRLLGDEFKAEYLLGLLQLAYWPVEDINRHLQGGKLEHHFCTKALRRVLYTEDKTEIITINYSQDDRWQAQVTIEIPQAKLTLNITPIG